MIDILHARGWNGASATAEGNSGSVVYVNSLSNSEEAWRAVKGR